MGYGPAYGKGPGLGEKITGIKQQIKGKLSHNPELVEQGQLRKTGELKKRQQEDKDPFQDPISGSQPAQAAGNKSANNVTSSAPHERASTVAPRGTDAAKEQSGEGRNVKMIDESA